MIREPMTPAPSAIAALIALGMAGPACAQSSAAKVVLITAAEANLPHSPDVPLTTRAGVTRGPKIVLVSPAADADVKSPLHLRLKFETFGGAKIDLSSVKVTYLKNPAVDLTARLGPITQPTASTWPRRRSRPESTTSASA
jgi:hypothetical protein